MDEALDRPIDEARHATNSARLPASPSTPTHRPVGAELKQLQDRLLLLGEALKEETDPEASELIAKALDALRSQRLSVCVVGQVNAGKTTLVNALARQPDLLPVSQEPWTAVVTRLHFGLQGYPEQSCHFQFFDETEWQQLAEHGGKLRELAERFLPGFNSSQLQQQIDVMKHRAQARLGPAFTELLGKSHSFPSLQSQVVAQYISCGASIEAGADRSSPNYADITRSADLFFKLEPFGYPLTLIDTPGTNDPFLVREETTLRCLDASDACVVVIDATKGVTDSDLGLFRILRGVNAQRLILFVNKVDLLPGPPGRIAELAGRIADTVSHELGSSKIPVILGCAQSEAECDDTANSPHARGLRELEDALSDLVHHGNSAHYVHQASATLAALADGVRSQAAAQASQLKTEQEVKKASFDGEIQRARALAFLQDLSDQIARTTGDTIASIRLISGGYETQALSNLHRLVEHYATTKKNEFLRKYPSELPTKVIRFDTTELRREILATHTQDYRRARRQLTNTLRLAGARLMFLINQVQAGATVKLDIDAVSRDFIYPSQVPLGQTLAIDLDEPFWRRWWRRRVTPNEAAQSLETLILQEFLPILPQLVALGKRELETEIDYSTLQLSISGTNLAQSLKSEQLSIVASNETPAVVTGMDLSKVDPNGSQADRPASIPVDPRHPSYQLEKMERRHHRASLLLRDLSALTNECQDILT